MIPAPNSYFMDVKCSSCSNVTTVFSHSQTQIDCNKCKRVLGKPSGGKLKLGQGTQFKVKV